MTALMLGASFMSCAALVFLVAPGVTQLAELPLQTRHAIAELHVELLQIMGEAFQVTQYFFHEWGVGVIHRRAFGNIRHAQGQAA